MTAQRGTRFRQALRWGAVLALGVGYSVLAHRVAAAAVPDVFSALVAVSPMTALAFVMAWRSSRRALLVGMWLLACAGLYGISGWLVTNYHWVFVLEHAGVYALLCLAFGRSLQPGRTPMVTGFARLVHREMSPTLISYTRKVTWAWTLYFGGISALSLLLFWLAPVAVWSTFANLLGFPLLALMFAGEYAVRFLVLPAQDRAGPLDAIRAYRQASTGGSARHP
ncbi:MAG: putative transrane protein [Ramlibacter sp.]|mgnify:CR=1 FL=1|nr:putative transrane protein [Ramlibacter sp.]